MACQIISPVSPQAFSTKRISRTERRAFAASAGYGCLETFLNPPMDLAMLSRAKQEAPRYNELQNLAAITENNALNQPEYSDTAGLKSSVEDTAYLAKAHAASKFLLPPDVQTATLRRNANISDEKGVTPLIYSAAKNWPDAAEVLLKFGADVNAVEGDLKWSALMYAAYLNQEQTAEVLLRYRANVDARDANGHTALLITASLGHAGPAKVLLRYGANPEARGDDNLTPLMWAAYKSDDPLTAELLLEYGAHTEERDTLGRTALMYAAMNEKDYGRSNFYFLIDHGADVFAQDANGDTVLHHAARTGDYRSAWRLLRETRDKIGYADPKTTIIENANKETAAELADKSGNQDIAELIRHFWDTGDLLNPGSQA